IDVRQQKDSLRLLVAPRVDRHQAALLRMIGPDEQVQIGVRETRRLQMRRHALGSQRATSRGQRRVGLDQLLVQIAEALLAGIAVGAGTRHGDNQCRGRQDNQCRLHGASNPCNTLTALTPISATAYPPSSTNNVGIRSAPMSRPYCVKSSVRSLKKLI